MIKDLSTADLNSILARLKIETSGIWYRIEMNANGEKNDEKLHSEFIKNDALIEKIEKEIDSRTEELKNSK